MRCLLAVLVVSLLGGCAGEREARKEEPAAPKLPELAPSDPRLGLLVLYRPFEGSYRGSGFATVHVFFDGVEVGELGTNDFALLEASPGPHAVVIRSAFGQHAVTWGAVGGFTRYLIIDTEGNDGPRMKIKESADARREMEGMSVKLKKVLGGPSAPTPPPI